MISQTWITPKEAAFLCGISATCFREEWVPEDGLPQVTWRNVNGKTGPGRRIQVLKEDLDRVLQERTVRPE